MENSAKPDAPKPDPATAAFTRLADKVELLEAAVTGLVTKREAMPDYSATLGEMAKRLGAVAQGLGVIAEKPAMQLTPEGLAARIDTAAQAARRSDQAALAEARERFDQGARIMREIARTVHNFREQRRRLLWAAGGGLLAGMLLWSFLPGVVLRTLPQSWHMPESMARHIIGEPTLWEAGTRLIRAESPQAWQAFVEATDIQRDNREAIEKCHAEAVETMKATRCTVVIQPAPRYVETTDRSE